MYLLFQHANGENSWVGIDGNSGAIVDMKERKVYIYINHHKYSFHFLIFCVLSNLSIHCCLDMGCLQCQGADI